MNATPIICPLCGELIIAWFSDNIVILPEHTDRIFPAAECPARTAALPASSRK